MDHRTTGWFGFKGAHRSPHSRQGHFPEARQGVRGRRAPPAGVTAPGCVSLQETDRAIPVLIIGILVFLPGFYHLRIAYYASKGYRGYSYDDIPDFDD